ncbi:TIGR04086 family membrane protein [Paenibacillus sp. J2TS4]|uniref:TIGR04086 family membrane protein n=1 Tax=Paenibacillus sp. J2TS4 TaxID=2807194 RepID=UPI001B09DAC9|nr:TIGR04086 family membrane protein [Paenibacillus sp. J2TS4]GIP31396.1 hypothetical protein J2TS4_06060 [Paenibacillus sp. J2TS4]
MESKNNTSGVRIHSPILAGLLYAFIIMSIAAVLTSLILMLTDQKEDALPAYAYIIHTVSLCLGGWIAGKRAELKGWYYGGILGLIYSIIIILIGFLGFDKGFDLNTILFSAASFFIGALGGIIGVNTNK